jgi:hypothetical protein
VAEIGQDEGCFLYAFRIPEAQSNFWDIEFPAPGNGKGSVARLLMECSFCQRREVAYLSLLDLKSFESHKAVARICHQCQTPSIWIEAQSDKPSVGSPQDRDSDLMSRRIRITAHVSACIRRRDTHEEVAVCEDLSAEGVSFRSRDQYLEGTRIELAVPFTPGAGAIFLPMQVVSSLAVPGAGLFRHGAVYVDVLSV